MDNIMLTYFITITLVFNISFLCAFCNWFLPKVLGSCEAFEERQVGNERFNIFSGCPSGQTATIVLRGGADQVCCYEQLLFT